MLRQVARQYLVLRDTGGRSIGVNRSRSACDARERRFANRPMPLDPGIYSSVDFREDAHWGGEVSVLSADHAAAAM